MNSQSRGQVTRLIACVLVTLAAVSLAPSRALAGCAGHLSAVADPFSSLAKLEVLSPSAATPLPEHSSPSPCRGLSCSGRDSVPKPALPLKPIVRAEICGAIPQEIAIPMGAAGLVRRERGPAWSSLRFSRIDRPPRFASS